MKYQTIAEETTNDGKDAVARRYNHAFLDTWMVGRYHRVSLIRTFESYRMGYLDYCAEQGMHPVLLD